MKDLLFLSVKNLFGHFNYNIDFEANNGFTIIAAPNSFGKSTILKAIRAVLCGDPFFFGPLDFEEFNFRFRDIPFKEAEYGDVDVVDEDKPQTIVDLQVKKIPGDDFRIEFNYLGKSFSYTYSTFRKIEKLIDENIKEMENRSFPDEPFSWWILDKQYNSPNFTMSDIYHLFGFSEKGSFFAENVPWVKEFGADFKSVVGFFVKGLYDPLDSANNSCSAEGLLDSFIRGARVLRERHNAFMDSCYDKIQSGIREGLEQFSREKKHSTKDLYNMVYNKWVDYKEKYAKEDPRGLFLVCDKNGRNELDVYKPRLDYAKDELMNCFVSMDFLYAGFLMYFAGSRDHMSFIEEHLNRLLYRKRVVLGGEDMLKVFDTVTGKEIPLHCLSSGENQMIGALGIMIFQGDALQKQLLTIVDEPETSLHPAWQEELARFCFEANQKFGQRFIFASHSPIFIGNYRSHMVDLYKQGMES